MIKNKYNVICIKWGAAYSPDYINKLKNMIKRNTSFEIDFYCFTDNSDDFDKDIIVKPLPILNTIPEYQHKYGYKKEAGLCDDNLGELTGQRVFFFDLDMLIIDNLDEFFKYPKDKKFYIIKDWSRNLDSIGQASCYSWIVGKLGFVKNDFENEPKKYVDIFYTASQEYLSSKVIEKYGELNFWPKNWFRSFRFHCMPSIGPLRHFITPKIPQVNGLKVIVMHGYPNPQEAIDGVWLDKKGKPIKGYKRLYKVCKPTKWILDYWK